MKIHWFLFFMVLIIIGNIWTITLLENIHNPNNLPLIEYIKEIIIQIFKGNLSLTTQ